MILFKETYSSGVGVVSGVMTWDAKKTPSLLCEWLFCFLLCCFAVAVSAAVFVRRLIWSVAIELSTALPRSGWLHPYPVGHKPFKTLAKAAHASRSAPRGSNEDGVWVGKWGVHNKQTRTNQTPTKQQPARTCDMRWFTPSKLMYGSAVLICDFCSQDTPGR